MTAPRSGWPYITMRWRGVSLPLCFLPLPSERAELVRWFLLSQADARAIYADATAEGATEESIGRIDRASLLVEGSVGYLLMRMWAGPPSPTLARWLADAKTKEPSEVAFPGPDHKLLAGRAFLNEIIEATGLSYEDLVRVARKVIETRPPVEPSGAEVEEVESFFGVTQGAMT